LKHSTKHKNARNTPPSNPNNTKSQEKGTKEFFSSFKGGFAKSDLSSLYITPDWNNPASIDGTYTQEDEGIAEEFRHYCEHLFQPKRLFYPNLYSRHSEKAIASPTKSERF
jgi:hypothetical protein